MKTFLPLSCVLPLIPFAVACGSPAGEGGKNPDPLPDQSMPNECFTNVHQGLRTNIADQSGWASPRSHYRKGPDGSVNWSPLAGMSENTIDRVSAGEESFPSNGAARPAACDELLPLFSLS